MKVRAGLVILALIAGIGWWAWARSPTDGPITHVTARIVAIRDVLRRPVPRHAMISIEAELANRRRIWLSVPPEQGFRCRPGDMIGVTGRTTHVGPPDYIIDPNACS